MNFEQDTVTDQSLGKRLWFLFPGRVVTTFKEEYFIMFIFGAVGKFKYEEGFVMKLGQPRGMI